MNLMWTDLGTGTKTRG